MVEITTADVDRAYDAAGACLEPLDAFKVAARALADFCDKRHEIVPELPENVLAEFRAATSRLEESEAALRIAVKPVREMLHLCSLGRVEIQRRVAPTYIEAFDAYMREKVENSEVDLNRTGNHLWCDFNNLANVSDWRAEVLQAEFDIERARVKHRVRKETGVPLADEEGLWRYEGGRAVLLGELAKLTRRSRRLMQYFILRRGRLVTYRDLSVDVWEMDVCRKGTIQEAVSKLRKDLNALGFGDLAERLRTEDEGYLLL